MVSHLVMSKHRKPAVIGLGYVGLPVAVAFACAGFDVIGYDIDQRRIDIAAGYVPLERLAISPQCGFASVASGNLLSADDQWRKLQLVADTARRVWG